MDGGTDVVTVQAESSQLVDGIRVFVQGINKTVSSGLDTGGQKPRVSGNVQNFALYGEPQIQELLAHLVHALGSYVLVSLQDIESKNLELLFKFISRETGHGADRFLTDSTC